MKARLFFWIIGLQLVVILKAFGQDIANSAHDFSDMSWNTSGKVCVVCHIPQNEDMALLKAPFWNHATRKPYFQSIKAPRWTQFPRSRTRHRNSA